MAERRTRRRFTAEFKAQAVKRLLDGGKGLSEVATELGLSTGQLSTWRSEHLAAGSAEALAQRKAEEAETQRLRRVFPGGSRGEGRLRVGRAGEPRRGHALPGRRRERVRLLRLAARDPHPPEQGRGGS